MMTSQRFCVCISQTSSLPLVDPPPNRAPPHHYTNNMSSIAVQSLLQVQQATPPASTSPPLSFPTASTITLEAKPRSDSLKVGVASQNNVCVIQNPYCPCSSSISR